MSACFHMSRCLVSVHMLNDMLAMSGAISPPYNMYHTSSAKCTLKLAIIVSGHWQALQAPDLRLLHCWHLLMHLSGHSCASQ